MFILYYDAYNIYNRGRVFFPASSFFWLVLDGRHSTRWLHSESSICFGILRYMKNCSSAKVNAASEYSRCYTWILKVYYAAVACRENITANLNSIMISGALYTFRYQSCSGKYKSKYKKVGVLPIQIVTCFRAFAFRQRETVSSCLP